MRNNKTFIIAELSANHNNNLKTALKTIDSMAEAGADAVKIQTYKPQSLTLEMDSGYFAPKTKGLWKGYTPWKLYSEASMPYEWHLELKEATEKAGLVFFSSPFDIEGVDFLEQIGVPIYKIASFEITDIPLIKHAATKGKPMIISTGVATDKDIQLAVDTCREVGNTDITLLKCTSQYPATIEQANLLTIPDLRARFEVNVGLSDHTLGSIVPVVAVSLGATVIEKHFTLDRKMGGADAAFSMEPREFKEMCEKVRDAEKALGSVTYKVTEEDRLKRRSLFVCEDIKKGERISLQNVRSIRPGHGLEPKYLPDILDKTVNRNLSKGTPLSFDFIK